MSYIIFVHTHGFRSNHSWPGLRPTPDSTNPKGWSNGRWSSHRVTICKVNAQKPSTIAQHNERCFLNLKPFGPLRLVERPIHFVMFDVMFDPPHPLDNLGNHWHFSRFIDMWYWYKSQKKKQIPWPKGSNAFRGPISCWSRIPQWQFRTRATQINDSMTIG